MSEQATSKQGNSNKNINLWLAELSSLGIDVKCSKKSNVVNESAKELEYLADFVKKTLYQEYKTAYSEHYDVSLSN